MRKFQKLVDQWIGKNYGYWKPTSIILRLMEEVGELAREVNHRFGEKPRKKSETEEDLGVEIADVLFTLVCLANSLEIDLEKAFRKTIQKYTQRDKGRHKPRS